MKRTTIAGITLFFALFSIACGARKIPAASSPSQNPLAASAASSDAALLSDVRPYVPPDPFMVYLATGFPDRVESALSAAEAAFARGKRYYDAGHLDHAQAEFDRAVDGLLRSGLDVRNNPRVGPVFEHLVDRIHELEVASVTEAAPSEDEEVPAALEELAPLTFPPDPELSRKVTHEMAGLGLDLPITLNEPVLGMVNYFQNNSRGRRIIRNGLRRKGRYEDLITQILREEGLPTDLIFLAQAESAFQPHARSRARAVGMWQFMSFEARKYGLKVNWWVDERRDVFKSTRAAARYLRDLYDLFGDWYLALAAYNGGAGRVRRGVERTGYADYWEMVKRRVLPRETRNFVPIILAMALVGSNPDRYGIEFEPHPPLQVEAIEVSKPTDLRRIAEAIDVNVSTLRELNRHVLRGVTPPDHPGFRLYVPEGKGETLRAALDKLPESKRVLWQRHQVRRGQTLSHIADSYRTSTYAIAQANGISLRSTIYPGQWLSIPPGGYSPRRAARAVRAANGQLVYTVRRGDTLSTIAGRHRVSATALARANGLSLRSVIRVNQKLVIPGSGSSRSRATRSASGGTYTVRRGDTLSTIAARHGTSASTLARANGISLRSTIRVGDRLVIPGSSSSFGSGQSAGPGGTHRVRRGETLWELSRRYGVSVSQLRNANPFLDERPLRAGDRLTIPE